MSSSWHCYGTSGVARRSGRGTSGGHRLAELAFLKPVEHVVTNYRVLAADTAQERSDGILREAIRDVIAEVGFLDSTKNVGAVYITSSDGIWSSIAGVDCIYVSHFVFCLKFKIKVFHPSLTYQLRIQQEKVPFVV